MSKIRNIADNIEKSVLVLGPGIYLEKDGKSFKDHTESYSQNNDDKIMHYFGHDNLFRPKNNKSLGDIQADFAKFYQKEFSENVKALYKKISQIPYSLIISLNPDQTMITCYKELGMKEDQYVYEFYRVGRNDLKNDTPTRDKPYLLNLLGSYTEPESLIFTYESLFAYLRNILPSKVLPASIRTSLKEAENISFLGVEFDKWYFQLLVQLLTESDEKYEVLRYASPDLSIEENTYCICKNNFEINFVGPDVFSFIDELYYHCSEHETNKLRGEPILNEGKVYNPKIYISYKGTGQSKKITDLLIEQGKSIGYKMINYKSNLEFRGRTWEFMKRIGWQKYIIVVVSDEYLKSEYCMFEFKEIMRNGKKFEERVFPIVLFTEDIYKQSNWKEYEKYWQREIRKLKTDLNGMDSERLSKSIESIKRYEEIQKSIPSMMDYLSSTNCLNSQNFEDIDLTTLFSAIKDKIDNDLNS